ncbi:hypothetical protein JCM5350_002468 [Sporobolomyces pararoseus]
MSSSDSGFQDTFYRERIQSAGSQNSKNKAQQPRKPKTYTKQQPISNTTQEESDPEEEEEQDQAPTASYFEKRKLPSSSSSSSSSSKLKSSSENGKNKKSNEVSKNEVIIISDSDSEDGNSSPGHRRRRYTPPSPPPRQQGGGEEEDKIEKDILKIRKKLEHKGIKNVNGLSLEKIFMVYKKHDQNVQETVERIVKWVNGKKEKEKEKGKDREGKGKAKQVREEPLESKKRKLAQVVEIDEDGDEEEVDELESEVEIDPLEEKEYWLNVEKRETAREKSDPELEKAYKKAALFQLLTDWKTVNQTSIRNAFNSEECGQFYAPTWLKLHELKKAGVIDLMELKRARDMEWKEVVDKETGKRKKVKKEEPMLSRKLDLEMDWLQAYTKSEEFKKNYKNKNKNKDKKDAVVVPPPKKKTKQDQVVQYPGKKAVGGSSKASSSKTKAQRPYCPDEDGDDDFESGDGWGLKGGALATANKYGGNKKKGYHQQREPRFQVFQGGKKVDRKEREGTVAFSGHGRTLA